MPAARRLLSTRNARHPTLQNLFHRSKFPTPATMAKKTYSKDPQGPPPGVIPLLSSARAALQQTFSSLKAQRSKPPKKKSKASEGLKLSKEDWSTNATAQHEKTRKALLLTRTLYEGLFPTAVKLLEENPGSGLTPRQLVDRVVHSPQLKKTRGYNAHNAFGRLIGLLRRNREEFPIIAKQQTSH